MPIANLPRVTLAQQAGPPTLPLGGGPPAAMLNLVVQQQRGQSTCWAAVATSVSHYRNAASTWTECRVISHVVPTAGACCAGGAYPIACDQPNRLELALGVTGNLNTAFGGTTPEVNVLAELQQDRPVGIAVRWPDGSAHFVVIVGADLSDPADPQVRISDPWYGAWTGDFDALDGAYRESAGGTWIATYLTH